jgi:hypothetical protein
MKFPALAGGTPSTQLHAGRQRFSAAASERTLIFSPSQLFTSIRFMRPLGLQCEYYARWVHHFVFVFELAE